jgi:hypothetical protein
MDVRRLLVLIDYLPTDSVTAGAIVGATPGWSARDDLELASLNQLILQRRMWADADSGKSLEPIVMDWHRPKEASGPSSPDEVRAFFGGNVRVLRPEGNP